jgi:ankyrin repeat protein
MADLLRQYGAKTGAQIREGCTSLHWAARGGDEQCVELLLAQGAEVNPVAHGLFGRLCTPLDLAVKHPKVARLLLDAGGISTADIRALPPARR